MQSLAARDRQSVTSLRAARLGNTANESSEGRVFKESAEQRFPLSVFLAQPLPYFCQPLRGLGSLFSRRYHRCRSREHGGGNCKQRVVIC